MEQLHESKRLKRDKLDGIWRGVIVNLLTEGVGDGHFGEGYTVLTACVGCP